MSDNEFWVKQWKHGLIAAVVITGSIVVAHHASNVDEHRAQIEIQKMKSAEAASQAEKAMFDSVKRKSE